jgi:hypothetical protein
MLLGFLVTGIYVFILCNDYKKGVILIGTTIQLLSYLGTGIAGIKIYSLLALFISCLFTALRLVGLKTKQQEPYPKLLLFASVFISFCYIITDYYSRFPHTALVLINLITSFVFPYVLWHSIISKKLLVFGIKSLISIMIISVIFLVPEQLLGVNVFSTFVSRIFSIEDFLLDSPMSRYGFKRANSIFAYFTVFGFVSCYSFYLFFNLKYRYIELYKNRFVLDILCIASLFCAFVTGSRAIILALGAVLISILLTKEFVRSRFFSILLFVCIVLSPVIFNFFRMILNSMINSNVIQDGSSAGMRFNQLLICWPYFRQSPLWGNGRMYIWEQVAPSHPGLMGAESIWFSLLVDYGIMGCVSFVLLLIAVGITLFKRNKLFVCMPIAYLCITSLSPDMGIQFNMFLTFVIIMLKCEKYFMKPKHMNE